MNVSLLHTITLITLDFEHSVTSVTLAITGLQPSIFYYYTTFLKKEYIEVEGEG